MLKDARDGKECSSDQHFPAASFPRHSTHRKTSHMFPLKIHIYIYIYTHIYIGVDISVHLHLFFVCKMICRSSPIGIRLEPGFDWTPIDFR